ncbi:cobw p47k family domain-containing protein [Cyclospora cayetanensis]|uniref:Cobw p47k family domain-containing protein n=1 Tax=Cyclospora cayetanensis TaxID=88456 RepID=A0A1D3DAT3_9EIME|nr:cobw p47k family domain-containing protein [Cyclospora cayetanensis]
MEKTPGAPESLEAPGALEASETRKVPGASPVPVTIVTGLLGAGKTTLLRRLLRDSGGLRLLLVQNEFAQEMGIEAPALIDAAQQCQRQQQEQAVSAQERSPWLVSSDVEAASASDGTSTEVPYSNLVELPGGCLCCSVRGEMLQALEALLARYKAQIDAVLIETNGAADPQPICEGLWSDEQLMGSLYLDGVVCLIDAARPHTVLAPRPLSGRAPASGAEEGAGKRQAAEVGAGSPPKGALPVSLEAHGGLGITALKQVACADCVLLTKVDLVLLRFSLGGSSTKSAPEGPPRLFSLRRLRQTVGELLWGEDGIDGGEASGAPCEGSGETIFRCKGLFPAWRDFPDEAEDGIALAADGSGAVEAKFLFVGLCLRKQELEQRLLKCLGEEERTQ